MMESMTMTDERVKRLRDMWLCEDACAEAANRIEALTAERDRLREHVARMEAAIRDRIHWLDEDNGHCDCGACLALVAALKGESHD